MHVGRCGHVDCEARFGGERPAIAGRSDGVICAVLKNVGDSVGVDETIAQIETDKVTVDIKAPSAGTLAEILVRKEDTVTGETGRMRRCGRLRFHASLIFGPVACDLGTAVGQVIARVGPAQDGAGAGSGKERRKAQEHGADDRHAAGQDPSAPSSGATATPPRVEGGMHAHAAHAGRTPSLRFPPRVAPDGRRISDLPASEAAKYKVRNPWEMLSATWPGGLACGMSHDQSTRHLPRRRAPTARRGPRPVPRPPAQRLGRPRPALARPFK